MQIRFELFVAAILGCGVAVRAADEPFQLGPDSQRQEGIPRGTVKEFAWQSKIFDGTIRRYWVYVPAQYDASKPAAVMVFQDGHVYVAEEGEFRAPVVFDNLIHKRDMPVTIGIFIDPGHKKEKLPDKPGWLPAPENRSIEYDTVSSRYAQFVIDEILPEVSKHYKLTDDPEQRAICGISSGGICAWTVAWQRPDAFRKVLSHIGSFTDIRGGHAYPSMIRKHPRKPIRVFLQAGLRDLDIRFGSWTLANQQMDLALKFKKYDYKCVFGEGGHDGKHGGAILPDSLRWLWRPQEEVPPELRSKPTPSPGLQVEQKFVEEDLRADYLVFLPREYRTKGPGWPLIFFLHGRGESYGPLGLVKKWGPPRIVERDPDFPYIVVSPQCPRDDSWSSEKQQSLLWRLLQSVVRELHVDEDRIYLTGLSMGGFGSWRLAASHPERFAAAAPICGGGEPEQAGRLKHLPIWAFHGDADTAVPIDRSQQMVDAVRKAGSKTVRFTTYEHVGHNSWTSAYADPGLYEWFDQQRASANAKSAKE